MQVAAGGIYLCGHDREGNRMFTGLIERVGTLERIQQRGNGATVVIASDAWVDPLEKGESIAVNGACLTVSRVLDAGRFEADVLRETIDRTSLSSKAAGSKLNLERAMKLGDRIGGHMVSGHVDGEGRLSDIRKTGADYVLRISCSDQLLAEIVVKGSIALDGISLTVSAVGDGWVEVQIIPHTWSETALCSLQQGYLINIETDMMAKYVRKYMNDGTTGPSIVEKMRRAGFQ